MAARQGFLSAHHDVLVDFFEDWRRAMRWLYDPAHRVEAVEILASVTRQPASAYEDWVFSKRDYYRDPDVIPNLKALQNNLNVQKELGLLALSIDVGKYSDLSLVEEAARRRD